MEMIVEEHHSYDFNYTILSRIGCVRCSWEIDALNIDIEKDVSTYLTLIKGKL
jgi:hypothetical protein